MEKNFYQEPQVSVIDLECESAVLTGSGSFDFNDYGTGEQFNF